MADLSGSVFGATSMQNTSSLGLTQNTTSLMPNSSSAQTPAQNNQASSGDQIVPCLLGSAALGGAGLAALYYGLRTRQTPGIITSVDFPVRDSGGAFPLYIQKPGEDTCGYLTVLSLLQGKHGLSDHEAAKAIVCDNRRQRSRERKADKRDLEPEHTGLDAHYEDALSVSNVAHLYNTSLQRMRQQSPPLAGVHELLFMPQDAKGSPQDAWRGKPLASVEDLDNVALFGRRRDRLGPNPNPNPSPLQQAFEVQNGPAGAIGVARSFAVTTASVPVDYDAKIRPGDRKGAHWVAIVHEEGEWRLLNSVLTEKKTLHKETNPSTQGAVAALKAHIKQILTNNGVSAQSDRRLDVSMIVANQATHPVVR